MNSLTIGLLFVFVEACTGLKCYSCIGFDFANQEIQNGLADAMSELPSSLPQKDDPLCFTNPQDTKSISCSSVCVSAVGFANTENFAESTLEFLLDVLDTDEVDFGEDEINITTTFVQGLGPVRVAFHTCLDNLLQVFEIEPENINISDVTDELPSDTPACVTASGEAIGISANAQVCTCKTDNCNHMQIKQNGPATAVSAKISEADFERQCPALYDYSYDPSYEQTKMQYACNDDNLQCPKENYCQVGDRICCAMEPCKNGTNHWCRGASYLRSFKALNCTQVTLSNSNLQERFDGMKQEHAIFDYIPNFGECANPSKAAEINDCKTLAIFGDAFVSVKNFRGPTDQLPQELYDEVGISKFTDLGEGSATVRGCVDKIIPTILQDSNPKVPELKACGDVVADIYGALMVAKGCICNTPNCNDEAGGNARERAAKHEAGGGGAGADSEPEPDEGGGHGSSGSYGEGADGEPEPEPGKKSASNMDKFQIITLAFVAVLTKFCV